MVKFHFVSSTELADCLPRLSGTIFLANWEWEQHRAIEISRMEFRRQGLRDPIPSSRNPDY